MKKITVLFDKFENFQLESEETNCIKGGNGPTGIKKPGGDPPPFGN